MEEFPLETGADETQSEQELSLQLHIKRELEDDDSRDGTQTGDFFGEVAQLPKRPRSELEQEHSRDPESSAHRDVYRCQTCTKVFSNPANVNRHARSCSGAARAVGLELTQAEFFQNPEQSPFIHQPKREEILQQPPPSPLPLSKSGKWRCLICQRVLSNFESMRRHFKTYHSAADPKLCSARLTQPEVLDLEEKSAHEPAKHLSYPCNFCGKTSTRSHDLKRHVQRMHLFCIDCSTKFESQAEIAKHVDVCSKTTTMQKSSQSFPELFPQHVAGYPQFPSANEVAGTASGHEAPLNLKMTEPTAATSAQILTQENLHHTVKHPSGANSDFVLDPASHQDSVPSEITELKCFACKKYFSNAFSLRRHVEGVHMKAYNCSTCGKSFICKWRLSQHTTTCPVLAGPGLTVNASVKEAKNISITNESGLTSTPFTSKLTSHGGGKLEFSPIPHSRPSLEFSRLDDSGIQQKNVTLIPSSGKANPLMLPTSAPLPQALPPNPGPSGAALPVHQATPTQGITVSQYSSNGLTPTTSTEPANDTQAEVHPGTAPDAWTALRTFIFLRALQLARLSMQLPYSQELVIKQEAAPQPFMNSSGQQDSDSGNGSSNQNSDSEPKSEANPGNQNDQLDNLEVTPGVLKASRRSSRLNKSGTGISSPKGLTSQAGDDQRKPFQCKDCSKVFGRKDGLARHVEMKHLNISHACKDCGRSFKNKFYLEDHIRGVHEKSQVLICGECDKVFSLKSAWYRHKQNVHRKEA